MDINFRLFSERFRRLLEGEEGTLPDAAREHIQNLYTEIEIVTSLLSNYEDDLFQILLQSFGKQQTDCPELQGILKDINDFAHESDKVIYTFMISSITQQINGSSSKDLCEALLGLQSQIIDIRQQLQQFQPNNTSLWAFIKSHYIEAGNSSSTSGSNKRNIVGLEDEMEELLDLLIEGEPSLSVVAIVGSSGFDKTDFADEAYNSNYAKNYFDCRAWVGCEYHLYKVLDNIIKSVMPGSMWSEIMDKDYELKTTTLHDYLRNKRYLIVLDEVWETGSWDGLREILPDHQNGSRILMTLAEINILNSCQLENGEKIPLDLLPAGGPLRAAYQGWSFVVLYHGSKSSRKNTDKPVASPGIFQLSAYSMLPLYLKFCCLYFCVFVSDRFEISTRQLYHLWIAEDFIPHNSEATAEEYLEELIHRGFIQAKKRRPGGRIKSCYVPIGAWAMSVATVRSTVFIHFFIHDREIDSRNNVKILCGETGDLIDFVSVEHAYANPYVLSLLNLTSQDHHLAALDCEKICKNFKLLRVLALDSLVLTQCPVGIEHLTFLRYLKLKIPNLKSIPSSLCNLLNLYTLEMPLSYIDHTPEGIWKMHKLRHLNFGYIKLPPHPGKYCNALENLNFISALRPSCCAQDILGRLPKLQSLKIFGDLSHYQSVLSKSLCELRCLDSLKLVIENNMPGMSQIDIAEYQFPQSLTHLSLTNTKLKDDPMPVLEKLPHLLVLKLKQNSFSGRMLTCCSGGFPCLKVLHLKSMLWLDEWTMGTKAMRKLEHLIINPCAYLETLPEELWSIESLKKLKLWWPRPELKKRLRDFEDKEQYDIQLHPYGL